MIGQHSTSMASLRCWTTYRRDSTYIYIYIIVGDAAYHASDKLLTPYLETTSTDSQDVYLSLIRRLLSLD